MLIAIIVLVSLVLLIIGHELGHLLAAKLFGVDVPEFGLGFPPRIAAKKIGSTEYSVNWLPFGGFVRIKGEDEKPAEHEGTAATTPADTAHNFAYQAAWKRSLIVLAGVIINFIIGWLLIAAVFTIGTPPLVAIDMVQPGSPAATAGLKSGDVVKGYATVEQFIADVNAHKGSEMHFDVERGTENITITATPRQNPAPDEGALGVGLSQGGAPRENPFRAVWDGLRESTFIAWTTILGFANLIKTAVLHVSLPPDVVGPVGIFAVAHQAGQFGLIYLVQLVSIISINLAVLNLIPFPALDGGRFLFILIGKLKGSPVSQRAENLFNTVGFALLILLMVAVTARDVVRLF